MARYNVTYKGHHQRTDQEISGLLGAGIVSSGYTVASGQRDLQLETEDPYEAPADKEWLATLMRDYDVTVTVLPSRE